VWLEDEQLSYFATERISLAVLLLPLPVGLVGHDVAACIANSCQTSVLLSMGGKLDLNCCEVIVRF
jgi:hypothetical protein